MKIALKDLRPNPFRDLERLPTKPEKVAILKESIKETTFWDNIVCRKAPNGSGGYEIAYGHNRLEALKQLRYTEIDIPVRAIDNDQMAKIMARENHEEWGAYAEVDAETARAVIQAFADGKIILPKITGDGNWVRLAPSFHATARSSEFQNSSSKLYTAETLATFLGWETAKAKNVLNVLAFTQEPLSKGVNIVGLTSTQAMKVAAETRRVERETENSNAATAIGKQLAAEFRAANGKKKSVKDTKSNRGFSTDTVAARTNELMREARVKRHVAKKKAKKAAFNLQAQDRQVATFLDAAKTWEKALQAAASAISKFSPEAKAFTVRKLNVISTAEKLLKGRLK